MHLEQRRQEIGRQVGEEGAPHLGRPIQRPRSAVLVQRLREQVSVEHPQVGAAQQDGGQHGRVRLAAEHDREASTGGRERRRPSQANRQLHDDAGRLPPASLQNRGHPGLVATESRGMQVGRHAGIEAGEQAHRERLAIDEQAHQRVAVQASGMSGPAGDTRRARLKRRGQLRQRSA